MKIKNSTKILNNDIDLPKVQWYNLCNLAVMDEEDVRKEAKKIIEDISDAIRKSREDFASEELFNKMFGDLDN